MTEIIIFLTWGGAAVIGFFGIVGLVGAQARRAEMQGQLKTVGQSREEASLVQTLSERVEQAGWSQPLANRLAQADLNLNPAAFVGILAGIWLLFLFVLWLLFQPPWFINALIAVALTRLGVSFFLDTRRDRYIAELANQMPDTATLVSNSLKAGLSVVQAFEMVSEKMPRPTGVEFARLMRQLRLGVPFDEAIEAMMRRLPCDELHLLLTTIGIQRKAGGNLTKALGVMSVAIAARHRVRSEIATLTTEARYTSLVILALPVFILALLNQVLPGSVTALLNNLFGWIIMAFFIGIQALAFVVISRIANVKV